MTALRAFLGAVLLLLAVLAAPAAAQDGPQTLSYEYGPVRIAPGQNTIAVEENRLKPPVDGWITRFKPDLVRAADGTVPRVDVIHLHHGVWLSQDDTNPLGFAPLFSPPGAGHAPGRATRELLLVAVVAPEVPALFVEEAVWTAAAALPTVDASS